MDRTKVLYGPRTQAYGETYYLKGKIQVLDRTKALYGPRTHAYGETNYSEEKLRVSDTTRRNQTSVLKSETRCYQKYGQNSLLGYLLGWCILDFSFSEDYLVRYGTLDLYLVYSHKSNLLWVGIILFDSFNRFKFIAFWYEISSSECR